MFEPVKMLKALGDETRMTIVRSLMNGEVCACMFVPSSGKAQSTVSRHLRILEEAGIVTSRKDGKMILYSIARDEVRSILEIVGLEPIDIRDEC